MYKIDCYEECCLVSRPLSFVRYFVQLHRSQSIKDFVTALQYIQRLTQKILGVYFYNLLYLKIRLKDVAKDWGARN